MLTPLLALWTALAVQAPDSAARDRLATAVTGLSDSLSAVEAAAVAFRADLGTASRELVFARARRLRLRCVAARRAVGPVAALFDARARSSHTSSAEARARRDLPELERVLSKCERDYDTAVPAANADSLKAWGPYRLHQLEADVRRYSQTIGLFRKPPGRR